MPSLVRSLLSRGTRSDGVAEDERFISTSRSGALLASKERIRELDGEILAEIATDPDDD
jgi:hypothetical protein